MQARKSAGKISTLDLKPMRKDTRSPKQEQSVAPQNGPWSRQKFKKKEEKVPFVKKKTFAERSVSNQGPKLWNQLSNDLRSCSSYEQFKGKLKTVLFHEYFDSKI